MDPFCLRVKYAIRHTHRPLNDTTFMHVHVFIQLAISVMAVQYLTLSRNLSRALDNDDVKEIRKVENMFFMNLTVVDGTG